MDCDFPGTGEMRPITIGTHIRYTIFSGFIPAMLSPFYGSMIGSFKSLVTVTPDTVARIRIPRLISETV